VSTPERRRHLHPGERFAALLAVVVALVLNIAAAVELFEPQSAFGYQLVYTSGFEVASVDPESPAAKAGIAAGDHLDFTSSTLRDRLVGLAYMPVLPGERVSFELVAEGASRPVTLQAALLNPSQTREAIFSPLTSFLRLAGFIYIAVALIILLRRPNRMTWGLFLYLVSATDAEFYRFPVWLFPIVEFASAMLSVAGTIGLVIFAVRFPDDRPIGWRAWIDRIAIPIGALFTVPNLAWDATSLLFGQSPSAWMSYGSTFGALALILVAGVALVATDLTAKPWERQRLRWVIAGIFFTLLSSATSWARYWSAAYAFATADVLVWISAVLYALAPFAIFYAVARQRVFDISFVVSRTLVFTIVTATIFAVFALVEWLAGRLIERTGVTLVLVAAAAIGVAFYMSTIESKVEQLIERTLFRRRHQAERHLAHLAAGLPDAQNVQTVEEALMREPVRAYALSSSALYMRDDSGDYYSNGALLDRSVVLKLQGSHKPVRLLELDDDHAAVQRGDPVLAVPVFVRSRLAAVSVYGAHTNGEDIDPDEVASLQAIGAAAGIAYDHLEASRVLREAERWRRLAERQARELAAVRERKALLGEHLAGDDAHGNSTM
jgi:GAF domain-containing protein